jgi:hypothetical protein
MIEGKGTTDFSQKKGLYFLEENDGVDTKGKGEYSAKWESLINSHNLQKKKEQCAMEGQQPTVYSDYDFHLFPFKFFLVNLLEEW